MDYYTIDEHKVYWMEAMEVVIDDKVTLCDASKQLWGEAVELSLDIFRCVTFVQSFFQFHVDANPVPMRFKVISQLDKLKTSSR